MKLFRNCLKIAICIFTALSFMGISDFSIAKDTYPSKAVTFVVGYAAGGSSDLIIRSYAPVIEKILGQPVVVTNKPGAAAALMMEFIRNSSPDGYTLGLWAAGALIGPLLKEVPYHFFNDFTQIAQIGGYTVGLLVNANSPWRTPKDMVDYGQKNSGKLRFGSGGGTGTPTHIVSEEFGFLNNFKWVHVPFDGEATAVTALLGQHIDVSILPLTAAASHVKAGRLRLLSVFFDNRLREFPDIPTQKESGVQPYLFKLGLFGICGPKNLPTTVKENILSAVRVASKDPDLIRILEKNQIIPIYGEGEQWVSILKETCKEQVPIMKRIGLKIVRECE